MNPTLVIAVVNGQVTLQGPLNDLPLCLSLLAAGQNALADMLRQQQAPAAPRPRVLLADGSPAPIEERN